MFYCNFRSLLRQRLAPTCIIAISMAMGDTGVLGQDAEAPTAENPAAPPADVFVPAIGYPLQLPAVEGVPFMDAVNVFSPLATTYGRTPSPLTKALQELAEAKDDTAKDKIIEQLHKLLSEEYDRNLAEHEKSLDKMEERLEKLREQLSKRRSAKSKVVDLRIQQLMNESEGLGWPGPSQGTNSFNWRMGRDPFGTAVQPALPSSDLPPTPPIPSLAPTPTAPPSRTR